MSHSKSINAALIGAGRLGYPVEKYLSASPGWDLTTFKQVSDRLKEYDYLFLATPDTTLNDLIEQALKVSSSLQVVHFSGSFYHEKAYGMHPVYSFPDSKSVVTDFKTINYVVDHFEMPVELKVLFPNQHAIKPELKTIYHSYLSLTANYIQLLSHHYGQEFKAHTGLPQSLLKSLALQSLKNEINLGVKSFSGPWVRGEKKNQDAWVEKINSESLNFLNKSFNQLIKLHKKINKSSIQNKV